MHSRDGCDAPTGTKDALADCGGHWHAQQPQHSGLLDREAAGVSWQKLEHVQPDELPRQAALRYSVGTYWHQLGTAFAVNCCAAGRCDAKNATFEPEAWASDGAACAASQPQHSGLFDHEAAGVSLQKLEHVQPDVLPRQATLWKLVGTYWHQLGTALTVNCCAAGRCDAKKATFEPEASPS